MFEVYNKFLPVNMLKFNSVLTFIVNNIFGSSYSRVFLVIDVYIVAGKLACPMSKIFKVEIFVKNCFSVSEVYPIKV